MPPPGFLSTQAAELAGVTYRQLDYWARTGVAVPSMTPARGSGSLRRYSYRDIARLCAIRALIDAGVRLERIRDSSAVMELDPCDGDNLLVITPGGVSLVPAHEFASWLLADDRGTVLHVLVVEQLLAELDARVAGA
jgi:DNA-binding transcriptional MerR regulator